MKKKIVGIAFVLLSVLIMSVSAFVYIQGSLVVTQTVRRVVSTLSLQDISLDLWEGTNAYTESNAISITTQKNNVYLFFESNIDGLAAYFDEYKITVQFASSGTNATSLTLAQPDAPAAILLASAGTYSFNLLFDATAKSIGILDQQVTSATITVTAQDAP